LARVCEESEKKYDEQEPWWKIGWMDEATSVLGSKDFKSPLKR
jgi:hypothetical protein